MGTTLRALVQDHEEELQELQERIGYTFRDLQLLQLSLVHSSFAFERLDDKKHNETQEFLGDAVLDLTVGYILFTSFPDMREGELTRIRSGLVNESGLAEMAREMKMPLTGEKNLPFFPAPMKPWSGLFFLMAGMTKHCGL